MYRLKVIASVMFVAFLASNLLQGQDTPAKIKGMLPPNWGKLGLSDEQKQKVYKVQADYGEKIAGLEKQVKDLKSQERA